LILSVVIPAKAGIHYVNEFNPVSKRNALTYKFKCYNVVEESLAKKFGPQRNGWQLFREGEILHPM